LRAPAQRVRPDVVATPAHSPPASRGKEHPLEGAPPPPQREQTHAGHKASVASSAFEFEFPFIKTDSGHCPFRYLPRSQSQALLRFGLLGTTSSRSGGRLGRNCCLLGTAPTWLGPIPNEPLRRTPQEKKSLQASRSRGNNVVAAGVWFFLDR
jgi:hypothetical protein